MAYKSKDGQAVTRKLTEPQVLELIKGDQFDPLMEASRTLKGGYRAIATYREFEPTLRGRMTKARADRKAAKFQSMYDKIEKEVEQQRRGRWLRDLIRKTTSGIGLIVWLAIIAGGGYLAYLLISFLIEYLGKKYG